MAKGFANLNKRVGCLKTNLADAKLPAFKLQAK